MRKLFIPLFTTLFIMCLVAFMLVVQSPARGNDDRTRTGTVRAVPGGGGVPPIDARTGRVRTTNPATSATTTGPVDATGTPGPTRTPLFVEKYEGYLMIAPNSAGGSAASTEMTNAPVGQSLGDLKLSESRNAGYGLYIYDKPSKKYVFYSFDDRGNDLVQRAVIDRSKASSTQPVYVQAEGVANPDTKMISVNVIKEVSPKTGGATGYTGSSGSSGYSNGTKMK
jgi:hypothetical protein